MLYPTFPDFDANHNYLQKYQNRIERGEFLTLNVFIKESKSQPTVPRDAKPDWTVRFPYDDEDFEPSSTSIPVNVTDKMLTKKRNVWVTARLLTERGDRIAEAHGGVVKYDKMKEETTKYWLLSGEICEDSTERKYGSSKEPLTARGIPKMQVRLVYDRTHYPRPWKYDHYYPTMYVDEFWMTNDQLIKFKTTGDDNFTTEIHFGLMSAARWRFQHTMEHSIKQMTQQYFSGEDDEAIVQMRDLFANTNSYLLIATMVVSVLHMIFEYLALKNDVLFWRRTDAETLKRFVSLRAVGLEIVCNVVLWFYLYDQESNWLILILSLGQIGVDCWKLTQVLEVSLAWKGVLVYPTFKSRVPHSSADDYDKMALIYLSYILLPIVVGYAGYSAKYECHKSVPAYMLHVAASLVYALGFALMTPQLFINYRMKSVAHLPWRRFIYRAINTFIDDLFAFIIKMPTMHRMSCFRDDIVFLLYLYQRHIYPVDKSRAFDEDFTESAETEDQECKSAYSAVAALLNSATAMSRLQELHLYIPAGLVALRRAARMRDSVQIGEGHRGELDDVLVPLRQREKEIRQLRLEVDELQRTKERDSSRQIHGAVRARSEQQRRMDELSCRHRQRIEELQARSEAARCAEGDLLAQARELQHAAQRSARALRETEEDRARAEVRAGSLKHVVEQVLSDAAQYSVGNEELCAQERALRDKVLRFEVRCNYLRSKADSSSPSSPLRRWWGCGNQAAAEAAEMLRTEQLSQEVEDLQQQLLRGNPDVRRRNQVLDVVAQGISELSSELLQQEAKETAGRAEMARMEKSIEALQKAAAHQVAEIATLRRQSAEAKQVAEEEMKATLVSSDQSLRRLTAETAERREVLQAEIAQLRSKFAESVESGTIPREPAREPSTGARSSQEELLEAVVAEQKKTKEAMALNVQLLRAELLQEQQVQAQRDEETQEVSRLEEMASHLTDECDVLWRSVTLEKRRSAEAAAQSCEAILEMQAQLRQRVSDTLPHVAGDRHEVS
ncbi:cnrB [Symbiodinium sp. CCMP2456]|nr:cnrB [Symbiodinium sp. CCMP2456]